VTEAETDWKKVALEAKDRLQVADMQAKDVRKQADELRARATKYKTRLENAQDKVNELSATLITVMAERDALAERVARQDIVKRKVHEFRQSIIDGPLWELFSEL